MSADTPAGAAPEQQPIVHNVWTFLIVLVPMGTLVALTTIILGSTMKDTDAATLLGIAIPAVVSIGTAAFGVAVAYNASSQKAAAEKDKAVAEEEKITAEAESAEAKVGAKAAEQKLEQASAEAKDLAPHLEIIEKVLEKVRTNLTSPAGEDTYHVPADPAEGTRTVVIDGGEIASAEAAIASCRRGVQRLT